MPETAPDIKPLGPGPRRWRRAAAEIDRHIEQRDADILANAKAGFTALEISVAYGLSRQYIYRIIARTQYQETP